MRIATLRAVVERDYEELQRIDAALAPKAAVVISGAVLEGVLLDALVSSGKWSFEAGCQQQLNDMIGPAKSKGIITEDRLSDAVRKYRALVHPGREVREAMTFDEADAKLAQSAVDVIVREVRGWYSRQESPLRIAGAERPAATTPVERGTVLTFLPASQEALNVRVTSGHSQHFSILVGNDADEEVVIAGVAPEWNSSALAKIHRPPDGIRWAIPAKGSLQITWPNSANVVSNLVRLREQGRGQFSADIDFVFHCSVDDERKQFRKRVKVQVDPPNLSLLQWQ